jgi:hypothetical protein
MIELAAFSGPLFQLSLELVSKQSSLSVRVLRKTRVATLNSCQETNGK